MLLVQLLMQRPVLLLMLMPLLRLLLMLLIVLLLSTIQPHCRWWLPQLMHLLVLQQMRLVPLLLMVPRVLFITIVYGNDSFVEAKKRSWPDKLRKPVSFEKQCKEWPDKLRNSTSPRKMRSTSPPTRTPQPPDFTGDELTGAGSGKVPSPQTGEAWSEGASRQPATAREPGSQATSKLGIQGARQR